MAGTFGHDLTLDELRRTFIARGLELARHADAVEDMPWPLMVRELDEAFPGSKFILTERDTNRWYRSCVNHFGDRPYHLQQLTYGDDAPAPVGHEERYKKVYEAHNSAVRAYFAQRSDDLLVMRLEDGHGWPELGAFLGLEDVPRGKFVHTNSAAQRRHPLNLLRKRLRWLGLPIPQMER